MCPKITIWSLRSGTFMPNQGLVDLPTLHPNFVAQIQHLRFQQFPQIEVAPQIFILNRIFHERNHPAIGVAYFITLDFQRTFHELNPAGDPSWASGPSRPPAHGLPGTLLPAMIPDEFGSHGKNKSKPSPNHHKYSHPHVDRKVHHHQIRKDLLFVYLGMTIDITSGINHSQMGYFIIVSH